MISNGKTVPIQLNQCLHPLPPKISPKLPGSELSDMAKFAHVESRLSGRKQARTTGSYAPVNLCDRSVGFTSVAVGLYYGVLTRNFFVFSSYIADFPLLSL